MKFILYLVSGFILMYGSYFFYTLYSKSHQSNTNIFEDNFNLKTNKKQNLEFDESNLKKELIELVNAGLSLSAASKYLAKKSGIKKSLIYNLY